MSRAQSRHARPAAILRPPLGPGGSAETQPDTVVTGDRGPMNDAQVSYAAATSEPASQRAAQLREVNWAVAQALIGSLGDTWDLYDSEFEFLCECGRPACQSTISVTLTDYVGAASKDYDLVARCHEDPRDFVVERKGDYKVIGRGRSVQNGGSSANGALVGNWTCSCGQGYRVAARGSRIILWPRNSATGFRREPVVQWCVNGCEIDAFDVLRALVRTPPRYGRAMAQTAASL
jgi:hypothetical protein